MFKKKIHLILLLLSLFFIPSVMAWQTATFSDYTSSKNFTFTGSGNNTFYISLPKNATILGASVNVSGFLYKSGTDGVSISDSTNFIVKYGSTATTQLNYTHWNTSFILEEKDYSNSHTTALNVTLSNSYPKTAQAYDSTGSPISSTIDGDKIKWTSESMQASVAEYKNDTGTSAGTYMCNTHDCASPQSWSNFYADEMYVRWYHGVNCEGSPSIYVKYDSYYTATINLNCTLYYNPYPDIYPSWINTGLAGWPLLPLVYPHHVESYTMSPWGYDVGIDAAGSWMIRAEAINFARKTESVIYSILAPNNSYIDTTGNGNRDWSNTGELTSLQTAYLNTTSINNYLSTCTPTNGYCNVPFILHSDNSGIVQVNGISFTNNSISTTIYANVTSKFSKTLNGTVYISVNDPSSSTQTCNITANSASYNNVPFGNNGTTFSFNWTDGTNTFTTICCDLLGNCASNSNATIAYIKEIDLVEEQTGNAFSNFTQLTLLRAIDYTNSSIFDFKAGNDTKIYLITTSANDIIRIEKQYTDLLSVDLIADQMPEVTRVCVANVAQFYQVIFYSNQFKPIALKNNLANCYVLDGIIQYAYSGALMAQAQTIAAAYSLYTVTPGNPPTFIFLSSVDGSQALANNIDVIEFNQNQPSFSALTDQYGISFPTNTSLLVFYTNPKNNNQQTDLIVRNTTNILFVYNETTYPNNFTYTFNTAGLAAGTYNLEIIKHEGTGTIATLTRTFIIAAQFLLDSNLAIVIAIALLFFGLTFTATKLALGWFGIIVELMALAITAISSPVTKQLRLVQAVIIIMMAFTILIYKDENVKVT